jgi:hypothetical protein
LLLPLCEAGTVYPPSSPPVFSGVRATRYLVLCVCFVDRSILPIGTLGSVASLLAATYYQQNHDRNHKLWNIGSTERYTCILHIQVLLES